MVQYISCILSQSKTRSHVIPLHTIMFQVFTFHEPAYSALQGTEAQGFNTSSKTG